MSEENKRYYWLKLNENFFESDTIDYIQSQENGVKYTDFYLKLCLKSLKEEGHLYRVIGNQFVPHDDVSLSRLTKVDIDTVRCAMALFLKIGLVEKEPTGEFFLSQLGEMIGSECDSATRVRKHRAKQKVLNGVTKCNNNVTENCYIVTNESYNVTENRYNVQKCNTESESRERDIDIDIEGQTSGESATDFPTPEKVFAFYHANKLAVSPLRFWKYNNQNNWTDKTGRKIIDWRRAYLGMNENATPEEVYDPDFKLHTVDYDYYTG